jgi:hypothetical protein
LGTHLVKMHHTPVAVPDSNQTDQSLPVPGTSHHAGRHEAGANLFSPSKAMNSLGNKLKLKSQSLVASSTPHTSPPVKVDMQRRGSTTKLTEEECLATHRDKLVMTYETDTITPSKVWYPYFTLPSRGEKTAEHGGGGQEGHTTSTCHHGSCLECLIDTEELILSVRVLTNDKQCEKTIGKESFIRIPWNMVLNVSAITASSVFVTISGTNLKERIATHHHKLPSGDEKKESSLDSMMHRGVKFAKRLTPPPSKLPSAEATDQGCDEGSSTRTSAPGSSAKPTMGGGRGSLMQSSFMKQNSLTNMMSNLRTPSKRNLGGEDNTVEEEVAEEVDVLIGPCSADVLAAVIRDRIAFKGIRDSIKNLIYFSQEYSNVSQNENEICLIFVKAMNILDRCFQELEKLGVHSCSNDDDEEHSTQPTTVLSSRVTATSTQSTYSTTSSSNNNSAQSRSSAARIRMYIHSLLSLTVPLYAKYVASSSDVLEASACIERACSLASDNSNNNDRGMVSSIHGSTFEVNQERWSTEMRHWGSRPDDVESSGEDSDTAGSEDGGVIDVSDVIDMLEDIKMSCLNSVRLTILMGIKLADEESKSMVLGIIENHYTLIRQLLGFFLAEEEGLQRLQGQENKTKFIKYLIINDATLATELQLVLSVLGIACSPEPVLLGTQGIKEAMRLYNRCLVGETRKWLYESIKQCKKHREHTNTSSYPWDIEEIGGKIISPLPETFRFQMNAYAGLLKNTDQSGNTEYFPYSRTLSRQEIEAILQAAGLHEEVLRALCKSLLLLAVEFTLIIKSKHWDVSSVNEKGIANDDEQTNNLMFLVSLSNDSFRMQSVHVTELLRIESSAEWSQETNVLIGSIGVAFEEVCSTVTNQICRVIFSDLVPILKDFGTIWLSYKADYATVFKPKKKELPNNRDSVNPMSLILFTTKDFLSDLATRQEKVLFFDTFVSCVDIITMRYLMFLLETPFIYGSTFTSDHISRIEADMAALMATFDGDHGGFDRYSGVALRVAATADAATVITSKTTDSDLFEGKRCLPALHETQSELDYRPTTLELCYIVYYSH